MPASNLHYAVTNVPARPVEIDSLCELAAEGLAPMLDSGQRLFCHRLRLTEGGLVRDGLSRRYTLMALLGLHRYGGPDRPAGIDTKAILEKLLADVGWIENLGDLGLLLWTCAESLPDALGTLARSLSLNSAIERFPEGRRAETMDISWWLAGLAHAHLALGGDDGGRGALASAACALLTANQGSSGFFGHLAADRSVAGRLRGRVGSFADQVYPIYALARAHEAFQIEGILERAVSCATAITTAQGPFGQWWWHYDSSNGNVVEQYPVYSVHQDGMAPMALFALQEAGGRDLTYAAYDGLQWISGANELACDLRSAEPKVIWRSVYHASEARVYLGKAIGFLGGARGAESTKDLKVLFECRPYHLGWLLYALSEKRGSARKLAGKR